METTLTKGEEISRILGRQSIASPTPSPGYLWTFWRGNGYTLLGPGRGQMTAMYVHSGQFDRYHRPGHRLYLT
ncbi:MAG: hypothetical protein HGB14_06130 [Anaerolineaceae bacterium]|nr:hypothetical protein [Anaerolineaceae bacterium]